MINITAYYLSRAETWLLITTLAYFLMNGAGLFETAVIIPKWSSSPPTSLRLLQGPYAPDLKTFWIIAHSLHELTFIAAIVYCWQLTTIRIALLLLFTLHFIIRVWTLAYFAPRIIRFQKMDLAIADSSLATAVRKWRQLNYLRTGAFLLLAIGMVFVLNTLHHITPSTPLKPTNMDQRLSVITLGVNDLEAQKKFYKQQLGWQPVAENKDIVFFKMNGFLFSLFSRTALATGSGTTPQGSGFRALTLSINVPTEKEVDRQFASLKAKDIKILKSPEHTPFGGYFFTFTDPENNMLEIAYNPYIPLDADGNVITHKSIDDL